MRDLSTLMNTTQVAELLTELTGDRWDRKKVHLYWKRGTKKFPYPDETISGIPYWYRDTIEGYAKIEKEK